MYVPLRSIAMSFGLAAPLWVSAAAAQDRHVPVRTEPVAIEEVQQTHRVTGSLRAVSRAQIAESEATLKATQAMIDQRRAELAKADQDHKRATS